MNFQDGRLGDHIGYHIGTIFTTKGLLVAPMVHTQFHLNAKSCSGEEVEKRFSRWLLWQPYRTLNHDDLHKVKSTSCHDAQH